MNYTKSNKKRPEPLKVISPLHKAIRQLSLHIGSNFEGAEISPGEAHILAYLQIYSPCAIAELIRVFGHKKPTMTSILDRLEKRKLISRRLNPDDRRSFLVSVTKHGEKIALQARRCVDELDANIVRAANPRDLAAFQRVMDAIAQVTGVEVRPRIYRYIQTKERVIMDTAALLRQLILNERVLVKNAAGVDQDKSIHTPHPGGNCMNWVVGHLIRSRLNLLGLVGKQPAFKMDLYDSYSGYEGVHFDPPQAMAFKDLLDQFQSLQQPLVDGLEAMDADALSQPAPFSPIGDPNETVGTLLVAMLFHETYHVGQTGIQRRLLGLPGAIQAPAPAASQS